MTSQIHPFRHLVIVGGGTAGWMAASLFQHAWARFGVEITVVESEKIGIIGVGEGSTPSLRHFFRTLGIAETEWMAQCHATYKCGIHFPNWSSHLSQNAYFHPFYSELDWKSGSAFIYNANLRRKGYDVEAHPDYFWLQTKLAQGKRSPVSKQASGKELDYGYHFDSAKLGAYLKCRAIKLGIRHINDTVVAVKRAKEGHVTQIQLARTGALCGDMYLDCTGFQGLLIRQALNADYVDFSSQLLNDKAIAIPSSVPLKDKVASQTTSTAMSNGWAWSIPLSNRVGNGYVYSSQHISDDSAEAELRRHIGSNVSQGEARLINMQLGRVEQHWYHNVLAVGLSQGFIEPLEATAISCIQYTIERFIDIVDEARTSGKEIASTHLQDKYNADINRIFDAVKDYITAHYRLNTRTDSQYWIDNRENQDHSSTLQALLSGWDDPDTHFEKLVHDLDAQTMYLAPSWYCLFAGKGRFPRTLRSVPLDTNYANAIDASKYCQHQSTFFNDHKKQLLKTYGQHYPEPVTF
ncbi:tryptophan 7-halogenase [Alteromonas sediminis]|uniref:Tryptophan 7-halogenase n=1 Tax=Alteromonas sediminis TaxID=2259342 RepID=A0A3N5Y0N1_9ALTE|nr:tryptophan halogenase family protein [Alteromonas sediminis]RPJ67032.1 tryptophan 7-halogenase [Alteromonas sediminis]